MKKLIAAFFLSLSPVMVLAVGGGVHLDSADIDLTDKAALQRGARTFVNYCMGCHTAKYARYNRVGRDLGLTDEDVAENLIFTGAKVGTLMTNAMRSEDAQAWFGTAVPDLTLITRNRLNGPDWLYTYLRSFYIDESRPFGVNNIVFPDVGMPHVLWEQQGLQQAVYREETDAAGNPSKVFDRFEQAQPGALSETEYDAMILDLVAFLTYMGEPMQLERQQLGKYVLLFLLVFFVLALALKKEYWRDVH